MDSLTTIITILQAARQLPEHTGVDSFYLVLGGLILLLIGGSALITLLVWLRYSVVGVLVVVTVMGINDWRHRLREEGDEIEPGRNDQREAFEDEGRREAT